MSSFFVTFNSQDNISFEKMQSMRPFHYFALNQYFFDKNLVLFQKILYDFEHLFYIYIPFYQTIEPRASWLRLHPLDLVINHALVTWSFNFNIFPSCTYLLHIAGSKPRRSIPFQMRSNIKHEHFRQKTWTSWHKTSSHSGNFFICFAIYFVNLFVEFQVFCNCYAKIFAFLLSLQRMIIYEIQRINSFGDWLRIILNKETSLYTISLGS